MSRPIILSAFDMLTPVHQSPGLWRHPESRMNEYTSLSLWTELAQELEAGGFASLFLADIPGAYDVFGGGIEATARGGVQFPLLDPLVIIPALAAATSTLGFGVTASVTYEQPYLLARTLSTLDHLTEGRVAWNIVTSYQDSAARNLGLSGQIPHDARYDRADEYLDVVYKLFESSFEPGAVRADAEANVFVDPDRVHTVEHNGEFFHISGPALGEPGPQRTPFLFQAGASKRGQAFAAKHAEAVFMSGDRPELVRGWVDAVRSAAEASGRSRDAVKIFALVTVVVAETDEAAQTRLDEYRTLVDTDGALALFGGWTGLDLSGFKPDDLLEYVATEASQSTLAAFTTDRDRPWTVRDLAEFVAIGGSGPVIVGSPETVADELERWAEEADLDGFNVSGAVRPADLERFARFVSPELRRRGVLSEGAAGQTLRERISGEGPWLADEHYGAQFRAGA
jgi:FMN-dependent oxidoreductase (nitrilotriacetate monooxygenase family)